MFKLEKLIHTQTKERIAALLREKILSGKIKDGEALLQEQIAEKLSVSRMPVREAFQILELEGLLLRLPNRHIQVVGPNSDTIRENLQFIAAMETQIIFTLLDQRKDLSLLNTVSMEHFHQQLTDMLGNPYITAIYQRSISVYPQYIQTKFPDKSNILSSYRTLLEAIKSADKVDIQKNVSNYYQTLANLYIEHIENAEKHAPLTTH